MKKALKKAYQGGISYDAYKTLVNNLLAIGRSTGQTQSDALLNYSTLNHKRMKRLDKTIQLSEKTNSYTKALKKSVTWLVLTEGWCGDAAQVLPVINKIASLSDFIDLKIILRDEHEELMNKFLTNGSKSIPKLIAIDENKKVIYSWGPRPSIATKMAEDYKKEHGNLDAVFKKELQLWYNRDKGTNIQEDIIKLLQDESSLIFD